MKSTTIKLV